MKDHVADDHVKLAVLERQRCGACPLEGQTSCHTLNGGILLADVSLGSTVRKGDLLGTITDPMSNARTELRSPYSGRIIGMARNQVVMPGFAAFHVGIETSDVAEEAEPGPEDLAHDPLTGGYVDGMSE